MGWIEQINHRFRSSRVLKSEKAFVQDRCPVNLTSMPEPSAVLDADELKIRVEDVGNIIDGNPFCDIVALCEHSDEPTAVLIEAKTDRTNLNARTREAISQLSWSFDHFNNISAICNLAPIDCKRYPVLTFTKITDPVLRSPSVKDEARKFRRHHRARIHYVRAGRDIWQAIQHNTP